MPIHHVLVVDDSKSARLMLRKMLQGFGITVDTVESAEEALEYLRGQQPDGIFMDHTMPGMDGLTALTRIKADANLAAIPVAMYTSKDEPGYLNHALATGAVGVLVKPAMPDVLGTILDTMRTAAVAAKAPPSPEPLDMTVTAEWVGKLALEKAEQVFYDSIESQVLPLINDVVARVRSDFENQQGERLAPLVQQICDARLAAWSPPVPTPASAPVDGVALRAELDPWLEHRLDQQLEKRLAEQPAAAQGLSRDECEALAHTVAVQVCQVQLHELSERLVRQLSQRFGEAMHKAMETVRTVASDVAQDTVRQHAASTLAQRQAGADEEELRVSSAQTEQAIQQFWITARHELQRRIYLAAGGAAAIGVVSALLMYALR